MKSLLGKILAATVLTAAASPLLATVPVSCAPGLPPVQSEGIRINAGTIELLDDACRPATGGTLPPALQFSNTAATPNIINAGETTTYSASVSNFIAMPEPNVTYDTCSLDVVRPNGNVSATVPVPALSASLALPVTIPAGSPAGNWQLNMRCRRFVSGQEIVLPAVASVAVQVNSNVAPGGCESLPAPFVAGTVGTYESHYQVPFGTNHSWMWDFTGNNYNLNNELIGVRVRAYSFVAPQAGLQAKLSLPSSVAGVTASISSQCGNFDVPSSCIAGASGALQWSTASAPPTFRCALVPGQTYYVNFAWMDLATWINSGTVNSTCVCPGPTCQTSGNVQSSSCQFGNNATP
ncbi:MAG: hypothetical protein KF823_07570 [Xanthomonadales bacterium]|nr:hypothetical protein [Xanthomonadales bacterium]